MEPGADMDHRTWLVPSYVVLVQELDVWGFPAIPAFGNRYPLSLAPSKKVFFWRHFSPIF